MHRQSAFHSSWFRLLAIAGLISTGIIGDKVLLCQTASDTPEGVKGTESEIVAERVNSFYKRYQSAGANASSQFLAQLRAQLSSEFLSDSFQRLLAREEEASQANPQAAYQAGIGNADPFTLAQDDIAQVRALSVAVKGDQANVTAGSSKGDSHQIKLRLIKQNGRWLIDDIAPGWNTNFGKRNPPTPPDVNTRNTQIEAPQLPSGKLVETDNGAVLTLPSGEKFISETLRDTDGLPQADILVFPNGQKFTSETAKGVGHVPFVSTDGAVVAIARIPATKTSTLHIYFKAPTGNFKEIENANEQVAKLLTGVKVKWPPNYDPPQEAAKYALDLLSMSGHTLTLNSISYWEGESKTYQFKVTVASDGSLALAK